MTSLGDFSSPLLSSVCFTQPEMVRSRKEKREGGREGAGKRRRGMENGGAKGKMGSEPFSAEQVKRNMTLGREVCEDRKMMASSAMTPSSADFHGLWNSPGRNGDEALGRPGTESGCLLRLQGHKGVLMRPKRAESHHDTQ